MTEGNKTQQPPIENLPTPAEEIGEEDAAKVAGGGTPLSQSAVDVVPSKSFEDNWRTQR